LESLDDDGLARFLFFGGEFSGDGSFLDMLGGVNDGDGERRGI